MNILTLHWEQLPVEESTLDLQTQSPVVLSQPATSVPLSSQLHAEGCNTGNTYIYVDTIPLAVVFTV